MRFFNSRIGRRVFANGKGDAFFTTSEAMNRGDQRLYSVRKYDAASCSFDTIGKFQGYRSMGAAQTAAKRMAKGGGLGRRKRR